MSKREKEKPIHNLRDLHEEKARLKRAYKGMELNGINTILSSESVISFLTTFLFRSSKKEDSGKKWKEKKTGKPWSKKTKKDQSEDCDELTLEPLEKEKKVLIEKKQKSLKKLGKQALIWQGISLLAFIGGNIFLYFRKKKRSMKKV